MPTHPQHVAVWFEIPVSDLAKAMAFYNAVLDQDMRIDDSGPNPVAMFNAESFEHGVAGHLYPGEPSDSGITIHLAAPDSLSQTRARIADAGGKIESDDIPLPFGSFFYARDLDGNSIGIFEAKS
ncbi:MAG: VOC family protein [Pseudomonadota bacterium]